MASRKMLVVAIVALLITLLFSIGDIVASDSTASSGSTNIFEGNDNSDKPDTPSNLKNVARMAEDDQYRIAAADTYEPNNTMGQAYGPLQSGVEYQSYCWTFPDDDIYYFDCTKSGAANITLTNIPAGCDFDLWIADNEGTILATSENSGNTDEGLINPNALPGRYYLVVFDYSGSSQTQAYKLTATFQTSGAENPYNSSVNKYAFIVGISDYPGNNDLWYPDDDANRMRQLLIDRAGFNSANIRMMTNANATEEAVLNSLLGWLDIREDSNDKVVIYFSGHGSQINDAYGDEADGLDETLCCADVYQDIIGHITDDELDFCLSKLDSPNIAVLIDTCFSGGMLKSQGGQLRSLSTATAQEEDGFTKDINKNKRLVLTACKDTESALENTQLQSGAFTYFLVDALSSRWADTDHDDLISFEEAYDYLYPNTVTYCDSVGHSQHPQEYDGVAGEYEITATPIVGRTWYLAEGCTGGDFETWVLVQNPNDYAVNIEMDFMTSEGLITGPKESIPPESRRSYNVASWVTTYNVSTQVTADAEIICERAMYGGNRTWGHDSIGVTAPASTWYLAEGCTGGDFETWVLVQNPDDTTVTIDMDFQTDTGEVQGPQESIPARSRRSYNVANYVTTYNVSTKVTSQGGDIICERAMYGGNRTWGHDSIGVTEPDYFWCMAEGCTAGDFETWVLVQNPGQSNVDVELYFLTDTGIVDGPKESIPARSRRSYNVGNYVTSYNVSTVIWAEGGNVISERAMYGGDRTWGHDSVGVNYSSNIWCMAEGCTAGDFETWVLVQNPWDAPANIGIVFMTDTGLINGPQDTIQPYSRKSYNVGNYVTTYNVSTLVFASSGSVICERAMYGGNRTWGHDSIGYAP